MRTFSSQCQQRQPWQTEATFAFQSSSIEKKLGFLKLCLCQSNWSPGEEVKCGRQQCTRRWDKKGRGIALCGPKNTSAFFLLFFFKKRLLKAAPQHWCNCWHAWTSESLDLEGAGLRQWDEINDVRKSAKSTLTVENKSPQSEAICSRKQEGKWSS